MSAEVAIATPVLLLTLLGIVQFALWSHATHVAQAAAAQGLSAARVQSGTATAGDRRARQVLHDLGDGPLTNPVVHTNRTADQATVDIEGTATSVIPFVQLPVHARATGAVERFVPAPVGE